MQSNGTEPILNPSRLLKPAFLMNPPFSFSCDVAINSYMSDLSAAQRHVNMGRAVEQWLDLYSFLSSMALVYLIPPKPGLQDQPFVANLGIVMPHRPELAVISNFRKQTRRGETAVGVNFFKMIGYDTVVAPKFFEGEAELRFIRDQLYVGGFGVRTSLNALRWFHDTYGLHIIPVHTPDNYMYHLDCFLGPITTEAVIADVHKLDQRTLKALEKQVTVEPIGDKQSYRGLEMVRVGKLLLTHNSLRSLKRSDPQYAIEKQRLNSMETIAAKYGLEVVTFDISEFEKSGAGLGCLVMHLNYVDFMVDR